jgi:hypothetical protein
MMDLVKTNITKLRKINAKHSVAELYLFGSAVSGSFNDESDLDFAVVFKDSLGLIERGDAFFGLLDDLEKLFNKPIDLISYRALKNPIFIEQLNNSKNSLYAA